MTDLYDKWNARWRDVESDVDRLLRDHYAEQRIENEKVVDELLGEIDGVRPPEEGDS